MVKKSFALLIGVLFLLGAFMPLAYGAADTPDFELTIDVNERYTDISETIEGEDLFGYRQAEEKEKQIKRNTYIAVLSVALVISVAVLIVCIRRVPKEQDLTLGDIKNKNEENKKE